MIPPNTVPITYAQFKELTQVIKPVLVLSLIDHYWFISYQRKLITKKTFDESKYVINTHDYCYYFGEVVDLATYYDNEFVRYFGYKFKIVNIDGVSCVKNCSGNNDFVVKRGSIAVSKRWVCNFYNTLFKKDRPHDNIKFVWS